MTPAPAASTGSPCVLLVDQSPENRAVLRLALERRGAEILEAAEMNEGLELLHDWRPDVVVVDLEAAAEGDEDAAWRRLEAESHAGRLVVLGNVHRSAIAGDVRFFSKPYHFAPLIHKIEELMVSSAASRNDKSHLLQEGGFAEEFNDRG